MAKRLSDGSIELESGRIIFSDSVLTLGEAIELMPIFSLPPTWPFMSGGGSRGTIGSNGTQGAQGMGGSAGGPQGFQGNQGSMGPQGSQGGQGAQGIITVGPQGNSGNFGNQGPQGNQGSQGFMGLMGLLGLQGAQGNQGNQGAGFQGIQGHQGTSGAVSVAFFEFSVREASESTGPLGFTPLFMIYSGCIVGDSTGGQAVVRNVGFAIGVGALAKSAGIGVQSQGGVVVDAAGSGGDPSAVAGDFPQTLNPAFATTYTNSLDVTAFSAAGIELTWGAAVDDHLGKVMIVGIP